MGARAWATSADAPIFVDEWRAGPLTDSSAQAPEIRFCVPSERWWSSARVVRTTMEQLEQRSVCRAATTRPCDDTR
jgi:hypothetical protein